MGETTLNWVEVATLDDLWEGEMIDVEVDGVEVLLIHMPGGDIVAYQGICPHQQYSLVDGELDEEEEVLTCDAHHWQFNVRTGEGVNPTGSQLYRYEVRVDEDEKIYVGYPRGDEQRYNRGKEREQALSETQGDVGGKLVGPVLSDREMFDAVLDAAEMDNPGVRLTVEDRGGYFRVQAPGQLRLTSESLEEALGRPFKISDLEPSLSSFSGRMRSDGEEELVFYLERED